MKIVSFNINSFGGVGDTFEEMKKRCNGNYKEALIEWDKKTNYKPILELLDSVNADVIVLQEYYINSDVASEFEEEMRKENRRYSLHCNHIDKKRPLHTVVFCRDNICDEKQFFYTGRIYKFRYKDYIIIGAHMPFNPKDKESVLSIEDEKRAEEVENEWERIKEYLRENKDKKCILVGDLNVYDKNTVQYGCFERLFNNEIGMRDLWVENGNSEYTPTEIKYKGRLDYALVTPGLYNENKCNITMVPEHDEAFNDCKWSLSDHRMLIVEIEEKKKIEKSLAVALTKMFPNGGESYTRDDIRRVFDEEGVDVSDFDNLMDQCIKDGWIIPCGENSFTR